MALYYKMEQLKYLKKHRKSCECCPVLLFFVRSLQLSQVQTEDTNIAWRGKVWSLIEGYGSSNTSAQQSLQATAREKCNGKNNNPGAPV